MFCPQCRLSWPNGGKTGAVRVDKLKQKLRNSPEWGSPMICPNCLVPLAADRIQGEFPSVAHMSSTKEGSMTVKDVLRETAGNDSALGEVSLDDKKVVAKNTVLGIDLNGTNVVARVVKRFRSGPRGVVQMIALFTFILCIGSIVTLALQNTLIRPKAQSKHALVAQVKAVPKPAVNPNESALAKLMPDKIGNWTRNESTSEIWQDENVGNSTVQTFVSSYRSGSARVQLWAIRAPTSENNSALTNFEGSTRAVHTDSGVIDIKPIGCDIGGTPYITFDYTPDHPSDQYFILTNQTFAPASPHTISWYSSPFVVTVAAGSKEDQDNFVEAMAR